LFCRKGKIKNLGLEDNLKQLRMARTLADYKRSQDWLNKARQNSWKDYARYCMELATQILPEVKKIPAY